MRTQEQIDFVNRWIEALRSGNYTQGEGSLRSYTNTFCCLGVAADMENIPCKLPDDLLSYHYDFKKYHYDGGFEAILPAGYFRNLTGFMWDQGSIASKNDTGMSFAEIADLLQKMNTVDGDTIFDFTEL